MTGDLLRFTTAGSVDDGKSTLIGRLLLDSQAILDDQMAAMVRASQQRGDPYLDLALLTDGLRAEREQGITIDVAYRYFSTPRRKFIVADTPGHVQYTRNMVTGASSAELAVILVDARKGVLTQSKRHGFLASLLQIPHVVVAINKMDLVGFDEAVFQAITEDYRAFASRLSVQDITYIPMSALRGDNVVTRSDAMAWYDGPSLLHHLEHVNIGARRNLVDFRFPVQLAVRPHQDLRGAAGQVASGSIRQGEEVVVLPSGRASRVRQIVTYHGDVAEALAGDSVVLVLEDDLDVSRGDMLVRRHNLPYAANDVECLLCWMNDEPLNPDATYLIQHTTRVAQARVSAINYRINVDTLHREPALTLAVNDIGRVRLTTGQPLLFDPYQVNRATGGFILIDPFTNNTVAAGIIKRKSEELDDIVVVQPARRRSTNVNWEDAAVDRAAHEARNGHRAAILWLTGLSGSGKTTIARQLEKRLVARGAQTFVLDGDSVRHGLNGDLGFSAADRQENIRRVAEVAKLAFEQGAIVICSFISPFRRERAFARALAPEGRFIEIYVKCDIDVCCRRDSKGLYAKALRGDIAEFTGVSSPYEEPEHPELVVETDVVSAEDASTRVLNDLVARALL